MRSREPAAVVDTARVIHRRDLSSEPHLALGAIFGAYAVVLLWFTD